MNKATFTSQMERIKFCPPPPRSVYPEALLWWSSSRRCCFLVKMFRDWNQLLLCMYVSVNGCLCLCTGHLSGVLPYDSWERLQMTPATLSSGGSGFYISYIVAFLLICLVSFPEIPFSVWVQRQLPSPLDPRQPSGRNLHWTYSQWSGRSLNDFF